MVIRHTNMHIVRKNHLQLKFFYLLFLDFLFLLDLLHLFPDFFHPFRLDQWPGIESYFQGVFSEGVRMIEFESGLVSCPWAEYTRN